MAARYCRIGAGQICTVVAPTNCPVLIQGDGCGMYTEQAL